MRLYLPKDTCLVNFILAGVSCPRAPNAKDGGSGEPCGQDALLFTKELVMQREVREGGREEGRREGEGGRDGRGREGGRDEGGREGGRERGREGRRDGERSREQREGGRKEE